MDSTIWKEAETVVCSDNLTLLIKEARDRQRRRRRAVGGTVLSLAMAVLAFTVGRASAPGSPTGFPTAAGAPSSTRPVERTLTARDFVKYGIDCWTLRRAAIPIGPGMQSWCSGHSVASAGQWASIAIPAAGVPQLR